MLTAFGNGGAGQPKKMAIGCYPVLSRRRSVAVQRVIAGLAVQENLEGVIWMEKEKIRSHVGEVLWQTVRQTLMPC